MYVVQTNVGEDGWHADARRRTSPADEDPHGRDTPEATTLVTLKSYGMCVLLAMQATVRHVCNLNLAICSERALLSMGM